MTPAQRYLSRFARDVAAKYSLTLPEITGLLRADAIEARRIVFIVARDVLALGQLQTSEVFGTSSQVVKHALKQAALVTRKNVAFRLTVKAYKAWAIDEFARFTESMLKAEAAE